MTETTVLRVSHDVRLNVASYKLTSNIVQDHRQHIDSKEFQNLERVLPVESTGEKAIHNLDIGSPLISQYNICMVPREYHRNVLLYLLLCH